MYDISFIYSKQCDIHCTFCMYNCGPNLTDTIDLLRLKHWLSTVDMERVNSFGVYGGEVGINIRGFSECLDLVNHLNKPQFVITNGSWSLDSKLTTQFVEFCIRYRLFIVISGTIEHQKHQNRSVINLIKSEFPNNVRLKPVEENFYSMGRLEGVIPNTCTEKCMSWDGPLRIAIQPDNTIIFQSCNGKYPSNFGSTDDSFEVIDKRIQACRLHGFCKRLVTTPEELEESL